MSFVVKSQKIAPRGHATFSFDKPVSQFMVAIQNWKFSYGDDHHVQYIQIRPTIKQNGNTFEVDAECYMHDTDKNDLSSSLSSVRLLILAWTETELDSDDAIATNVNKLVEDSQGQSQGHSLGATARPRQSGTALSGFHIQYSDDKDHEAMRVLVTSSMTYSDGELRVKVADDMHDKSKHAHYSDGDVDVGALALFKDNLGLCTKTFYVKIDSGTDAQWLDMSDAIPAGYALWEAYPTVSGFNAEYNNNDYYIRDFGAGSDTNDDGMIEISGKKVKISASKIVTLSCAGGFGHDKANIDKSKSYCNVMVIGLLKKI